MQLIFDAEHLAQASCREYGGAIKRQLGINLGESGDMMTGSVPTGNILSS